MTQCLDLFQARRGEHAPLMRCFVGGMRKTLEYIQKHQYANANGPPGVLAESVFSSLPLAEDPAHYSPGMRELTEIISRADRLPTRIWTGY